MQLCLHGDCQVSRLLQQLWQRISIVSTRLMPSTLIYLCSSYNHEHCRRHNNVGCLQGQTAHAIAVASCQREVAVLLYQHQLLQKHAAACCLQLPSPSKPWLPTHVVQHIAALTFAL